jgi:hypothetical protein
MAISKLGRMFLKKRDLKRAWEVNWWPFNDFKTPLEMF